MWGRGGPERRVRRGPLVVGPLGRCASRKKERRGEGAKSKEEGVRKETEQRSFDTPPPRITLVLFKTYVCFGGRTEEPEDLASSSGSDTAWQFSQMFLCRRGAFVLL